MSKTRKLRRLRNQLLSCKQELEYSNFRNLQLARSATKRVFHSTPVPTFSGTGSSLVEEIVNYLYYCIDKEYHKAYEYEDYTIKLEFEVYLSVDIFRTLRSVSGYSDMDYNKDTSTHTFRGHKIIEVLGRQHMRIVRVK